MSCSFINMFAAKRRFFLRAITSKHLEVIDSTLRDPALPRKLHSLHLSSSWPLNRASSSPDTRKQST